MKIEVPDALHSTVSTMLIEAMAGWRNDSRADVRRVYRLLQRALMSRLKRWKADQVTVIVGIQRDYLNERNSEVIRRLDYLTSKPFREVAKELAAGNNWRIEHVKKPRRVERIAIYLGNGSQLLDANADRPLSRTKAFNVLASQWGLGTYNVKHINYQRHISCNINRPGEAKAANNRRRTSAAD
ncbi:hypothetical protein [Bradyrhizobium stylosanthis]|uniref:hypothetical protein n=1 Tax=Bradyrhizobium stylosanthis TaxID=1803665 RepID=UPI000B2334B3|nr:hypothetical protein [Bradyrhizobium stylosanthis]